MLTGFELTLFPVASQVTDSTQNLREIMKTVGVLKLSFASHLHSV